MHDSPAQRIAFAAVMAAGALLPGVASAVEPADLKLGSINITPTLGTEMSYMDNVLRDEDEDVDSWVAVLTPRLEAWMQNNFNTYSLSYSLEDSTYFDSDEDDFTDHSVNLDVHHEFNAKNVMEIYGEFYDGHEERGTGITEGNIGGLVDEPVELERTTYGGQYSFGSRSTPGRVEVEAKMEEVEYQNFRAISQFRDRDESTYRGTFFYNIGARTDALVELRYVEQEYDVTGFVAPDVPGSLDSEEVVYLVGITWEASSKTSGTVKVGGYDREYDDSLRGEADGFQWEVDVTWKPRTYSRFDLGTSRYSQETNGLGDYIDTQEVSVAWDHDWSSVLGSHVEVVVAEDDYSGSQRTDDRYRAVASLKYAFRRWMDVGAGYRYEKRDSDRDSLEYTLNVFFVDFNFSL